MSLDTERAALPAQSAAELERQTLDRSFARGLAWTGGIAWIVQLVSWVGTLVVARLLSPHDFGVLGMATFVFGFMTLVGQFGIEAALVQKKEIGRELVSHLAGVSLLFGVVLTLLGVAAAGPVAAFFDEPAVVGVTIAMSVNLLLGSLKVIPRAFLTRELEFRRLAIVDAIAALSSSVLTIVLAWLGWRYWSIVVGSLVSNVGATAVLFGMRPVRPTLPRRIAEISRELEFGWNVVASRVAWYFYSNADFAVVGRVLGTTALGLYNLGWTIANLPVQKIAVIVMQVTPPIFARVQDRPAELRRYLKGLTEAISVVAFPVGLGLALVAWDLIYVFLGEKWLPAVVPLQILAAYGGFRSVVTFFAQIMHATDHARLSMWFSITSALLLVPAFVVGAKWGTTGVALAWVVVYPAFALAFNAFTTLPMIGLSLREYLMTMWPAVSGCALMAAAVVTVGRIMPHHVPGWVRLAVLVPSGVIAYSATILVMHRKRVLTALRFYRSVAAGS